MPATAERARPVPISSLLDDSVPPRKRSPPPYTKLPDTKPISSPPPSLPSTPKPMVSPRPDKQAPLTSPLEPELKQLEKPDPKPEVPPEEKPDFKSDLRADPKSEQRADTEEDEKDSSGDIIDMEVFCQVLDLDDDEDVRDFSRGMVDEFFKQAEHTFGEMDKALAKKDLPTLSSLGHFLKGSSAALGVSKVQASCEKIQHYGTLHDEKGENAISPTEALSRIERRLVRVKKEYKAAEKRLKEFYPPQSH